MSYPDLVVEDGAYYVTETQKNIGRVHEIPKPLLKGLFGQFDARAVSTNGLVVNLPSGGAMPGRSKMPRLPGFNFSDRTRPDHGVKDARTGFSLDLGLTLDSLAPGRALLDTRLPSGQGILVSTVDGGALRIVLHDGRELAVWDSDRGVLKAGQPHHVVITVDGGPKIITFVVDGVLCDGGDERQFGWGRYSPTLRTPNGSEEMLIDSAVRSLRVYNRALTTSEAVGNYRAGSTVR
jgi:hypothetical protein